MCFNDRDLQLIREALYVTKKQYEFFDVDLSRVSRITELIIRIDDHYKHIADDLSY